MNSRDIKLQEEKLSGAVLKAMQGLDMDLNGAIEGTNPDYAIVVAAIPLKEEGPASVMGNGPEAQLAEILNELARVMLEVEGTSPSEGTKQ